MIKAKLMVLEKIGRMSVAELIATLETEEPGTLVADSKIFAVSFASEHEGAVGKMAGELARALTTISRMAADTQPERNFRLAKLLATFSTRFSNVARLYPASQDMTEQPVPSTVQEATAMAIEIAIKYSCLDLAEVLDGLRAGLGGDKKKLDEAYRYFESAVDGSVKPPSEQLAQELMNA